MAGMDLLFVVVDGNFVFFFGSGLLLFIFMATVTGNSIMVHNR